jgi:hypothetical protein
MTEQIALNYLAVKASQFHFTVYRRLLSPEEPATPGLRWLTPTPETADTREPAQRYEVAYVPREGFEQTSVHAWSNPPLTADVIFEAIRARISKADLNERTELPAKLWKKEVAFQLATHEQGIRELMWVRPFAVRSVGRFGLLLNFHVRVPHEATLTARRKLELSLTQKGGRTNEDYYLDQYGKVAQFLNLYYSTIQTLELPDGSNAEVDGRLLVVPSFRLERRTYVFAAGKEAQNQFFGLKANAPLAPADPATTLAFLFQPSDRAMSQDLFRALRGDSYTTFPGMAAMFKTPIDKQNVTGVEVANFEPAAVRAACDSLKTSHPGRRVLPVALVPFSKYESEEMTLAYFRAKHSFLSAGLASQFIDRVRTMSDRNALKWSISNIGLGIFAKMGGAPWKVKPSTDNCLIVGIGQAHKFVGDSIEKYVAYSVLTDSSGIYETIRVLGNSSDHAEYLASLRENLRAVLLNHRDKYKSFVIHATFSLRREDINTIKGLLDELKKGEGSGSEFAVLKFNDHNDFFGYSPNHNSRVPSEGTVVSLSKKQFVVWFSGVSAADSKAPKKPERPVHVDVLYPEEPLGEQDIRRLLQDAVNIAGANWRGFNAKSMPVSVYYAKLIADHYANFRQAGLSEVSMDKLPPWFL